MKSPGSEHHNLGNLITNQIKISRNIYEISGVSMDTYNLYCCHCRLELSTFEKEAAGSVVEMNGDDDLGTRKTKHLKKWYGWRPRPRQLYTVINEA
jgi:hypothetical protein